MKKRIVALVFGLLINVSVMAQSKAEKRALKVTNKKIEKIEAVTELSELEKKTYRELNQAYLIKHFEIEKYKETDPAQFKTEIRINNKAFMTKLTEVLGKERAKEIIKASKGRK